jgi:hypothetical protein
MTRARKEVLILSIDEELQDLQPDRYASPIARARVRRIVRRGPARGEAARDLTVARVEESMFRALVGS